MEFDRHELATIICDMTIAAIRSKADGYIHTAKHQQAIADKAHYMREGVVPPCSECGK